MICTIILEVLLNIYAVIAETSLACMGCKLTNSKAQKIYFLDGKIMNKEHTLSRTQNSVVTGSEHVHVDLPKIKLEYNTGCELKR